MMSHSSFDSGPVVKGTFLILGTMAGQGRPIEWAAHHRKHHAFSDRPGDPHSPLDGFVHAYFGWILRGPAAERERYCKQLLRDRLVVFIDRTTVVWVLLGLAIPFAIGGWTGLLWGGFVRMAFFSQVAYSVNSFGHAFGSRAFETTDESRNNWILAVLCLRRRLAQQPPRVPVDGIPRNAPARGRPIGLRDPRARGARSRLERQAAEPAPRRAPSRRRGAGGLMVETATRTDSAAVEGTRAFLQDLFSDYPRDFAVRFWDDTVWEPDAGQEARFTVVLRHPGAVRAMFSPPGELTVSEAYVYDDFDVEGDLEAVFPLADHLLAREAGLAERLRALRRLHALPSGRQSRVGRERARLSGRRSSLERDRRAIAYHYDVSNEFFALWLDSEMVYSCAFFESPTDDLETAQRRKLEYVCRKLRLQPGSVCWTSAAAGAARHVRRAELRRGGGRRHALSEPSRVRLEANPRGRARRPMPDRAS
jgi:hypothetical protein